MGFAFGWHSQVYNFEGFEFLCLGYLHVGVKDLSELEMFCQEGVVEQPQFKFYGYAWLIDKGDLLFPWVAFNRNAAEINFLVLDKDMWQNNISFNGQLIVFGAFDVDLNQIVNVHHFEWGQFKA